MLLGVEEHAGPCIWIMDLKFFCSKAKLNWNLILVNQLLYVTWAWWTLDLDHGDVIFMLLS
jgi:hypothetical protein